MSGYHLYHTYLRFKRTLPPQRIFILGKNASLLCVCYISSRLGTRSSGEQLLGWLSRASLFLVGFPHSLLCWEPGGQLVTQHSLGSDSWILVPLQRLLEHRKLMYKELHASEQGFLLQLREESELDPEGQSVAE